MRKFATDDEILNAFSIFIGGAKRRKKRKPSVASSSIVEVVEDDAEMSQLGAPERPPQVEPEMPQIAPEMPQLVEQTDVLAMVGQLGPFVQNLRRQIRDDFRDDVLAIREDATRQHRDDVLAVREENTRLRDEVIALRKEKKQLRDDMIVTREAAMIRMIKDAGVDGHPHLLTTRS